MKLPWNKTSFKAGGFTGVGKELGNVAAAPTGWTAPKFLDYRGYMLERNDQGRSSTCVAFSTCGVIEAMNWRRTHIATQLDPHPLYIEAKKNDGDPNGDGTTLTAGFQAAKALGLIPSSATAVYIQRYEDLLFCLHKYGPVVGGFQIDDGWNYAERGTGWIPPGSNVLGGHAVVVCFADAENGSIGIQNSWGDWGHKGQGFGRLSRAQFNAQFFGGLAIEV